MIVVDEVVLLFILVSKQEFAGKKKKNKVEFDIQMRYCGIISHTVQKGKFHK